MDMMEVHMNSSESIKGKMEKEVERLTALVIEKIGEEKLDHLDNFGNNPQKQELFQMEELWSRMGGGY